MKWMFFRSIMALILIFYCADILAKKDQIIYGLENAEIFEGHGPAYIQAQSFLSKEKAVHYESFLESKTNYPVKITHEVKFNVVTIGPIASAAEVRKTARKITKSDRVKFSHKNTALNHKEMVVPSSSPAAQSVNNAPINLAVNTTPTSLSVHSPEGETPDSEFQLTQNASDGLAIEKEGPASPELEFTETPVANTTTSKNGISSDTNFALHNGDLSSPDDEFSSSVTESSSTSTDTHSAYQSSFIATIGGGQQHQNFASSTTINNNSGFTPPYDQDIYSTQENHQPIADAFFGLHGQREKRWLSGYSAGLFYQHLFTSNIGDTITQYSDPEFVNYNYDWDVSSDVLLSMLKVNVFRVSKISPYVLGGLGIAFNRSSDYQEYPINGIVGSRITPNFASHTTSQFAYSAGGGIDFQFWPQLIFSAEYQYQDLGKIRTGSGVGLWSGQSLNLDSYHVNAFLLNASFLFGK